MLKLTNQSNDKIKISNFQINLIISIFFIIFFFSGILISADYGLSTDEPFQRTIGYYWYINLIERFLPEYSSLEFLKKKFEDMYWSSQVESQFLFYNAFFDIFAAFIEEIFQPNNSNQAFILKHRITFIIFFISSIFFWKIVCNRFTDKKFSFLILIFYITTPRIFAEAFYNCKDIVFMSFCVFSIFYYFKYLDEKSLKNIFIFSLFAALATSIRIMGIQLFFLFSLFFLINSLEDKNYFKFNFKKFIVHIIFYVSLIILFWPYLWDAPFTNFIISFKSFANYPWGENVFYLGDYVKANNLPWHYLPVWIFISTPFFNFLLFLFGLVLILKLISKNFLNLDDKNKLWENISQEKDIFILFFFLTPIFIIIIFKSTLYGGWRHLYFIYPCIIYFIGVSINYLLNSKRFFKNKNYIYILALIILISNTYNIIKYHPYQNVYFNFFFKKSANKLFEIDYWGLGNLETIKIIYKDEKDINKSIRTASFVPLNYTKLMLEDKEIKFEGTYNNNQDYIFTNYIYESNPIYLKKYDIPKNYTKFFTLERDGIVINEVYKKD